MGKKNTPRTFLLRHPRVTCALLSVAITLDYTRSRRVPDLQLNSPSFPGDAKLNIGQESFRDSLLFRRQLNGAGGGRPLRGRASHRKFSLREPPENSIGIV